MTWMIEWKEYDPLTQKTTTNSDSWDKWEDVVRVFNDCIADALCMGATVYSFLGGKPYTTDDSIVLDYRP